MSVAIAKTPSTGVSGSTHFRFNVTGAGLNDATAYDAEEYPTEPERRYRLEFVAPAGGQDRLSYEFAPAVGGTHEVNSVVLDYVGTWTVNLIETTDSDTVVATTTVVIS